MHFILACRPRPWPQGTVGPVGIETHQVGLHTADGLRLAGDLGTPHGAALGVVPHSADPAGSRTPPSSVSHVTMLTLTH